MKDKLKKSLESNLCISRHFLTCLIRDSVTRKPPLQGKKNVSTNIIIIYITDASSNEFGRPEEASLNR